MKLDKVNPNQGKNKKAKVILTTSTIAVLTVSGICGWAFFKDSKNDVIKLAQSIVSGPILQRTLGEIDEEKGEIQIRPDITPDRVIQIESYLSRLGFGYLKLTDIDVSMYKDITVDYEFAAEKDGGDGFIYLEALYCLYKGVDITTKPDYAEDPGEKPEIQSEVEQIQTGLEENPVIVDENGNAIPWYSATVWFVGLYRTCERYREWNY